MAIIRSWRPDLLEKFGVGPIVGRNGIVRLVPRGPYHSEAAFATLAWHRSRRTVARSPPRYPLNRYGDRQLNNAVHAVVQGRSQYQPATRAYVARRTAEGKTSRKIRRCLARDLYRRLDNPAATF